MTPVDSSSQKVVIFTQPDQIEHILAEAVRLKSVVFIRFSDKSKAVRGLLCSIDSEKKTYGLSEISLEGARLLLDYPTVRIELILFSKKLSFVSSIVDRTRDRIYLQFPIKLLFIERRAKTRFKFPKNISSFVEFPEFIIDGDDPDGPYVPTIPYGPANSVVQGRMRMEDISLEGGSCLTRYFAFAKNLKTQGEKKTILLHLPYKPVFPLLVSVRWFKKTVMVLSDDRRKALAALLSSAHLEKDMENFRDIVYRVGFQFLNTSPECHETITRFCNEIQTSDFI